MFWFVLICFILTLVICVWGVYVLFSVGFLVGFVYCGFDCFIDLVFVIVCGFVCCWNCDFVFCCEFPCCCLWLLLFALFPAILIFGVCLLICVCFVLLDLCLGYVCRFCLYCLLVWVWLFYLVVVLGFVVICGFVLSWFGVCSFGFMFMCLDFVSFACICY